MTDTAELMHYGVPGMKWGVRKRVANERVREYGDKGKATMVELGKMAGALVLTNVGTYTVSQVTGHNSTAVGISALVGAGAILASLISGVRNIVDIARTDLKDGPKLDVKKD